VYGADGDAFGLGRRSATDLADAADAFQAAMWVAAALAVAGAAVSALGLPRARSGARLRAPDSA
jgi:hypothetical protein